MNEKMPKVKIRGTEYELKPLGILAVYEVVDIINNIGKKVSEKLGKDIDITKISKLNKSVQMKLMFIALSNSKQEVFRLLEMVTGLGLEELKDPNKFPPNSPIKIFKALWKHPDIKELKDDLGNIIEVKERKKN